MPRGDSMENRIKGGLYGLSVGDALGCTVEFMMPEHIQKVFGVHKDIVGGGIFGFEKGEVTDDTDMALCVARGIIQAPDNPIEAIGEEFVNWVENDPKDVGMTVRQSVINYMHEKDWELASLRTHQTLNGKSGGNGSLMRCLPISLAYTNLNHITRYSHKQSVMTHYDREAAHCCALYNQIAYFLLQGWTLEDSFEKVLERTRYLSSMDLKPSENPDAYVMNTFKWMVYTLTHTNSFEEAVVYAVNLGHDADTLASVVGGLGGIHYGYESIPSRFIDVLLCKEELDKIAENLLSVRNNN